MALVYRDCVKQTTTSTDTDDLVLDSETAFQGYRTFDDALSDGDTCYYLLDEKTTGQWEIGLGTFESPSVLARTTVYQSSNGNAKIDLYSGSYPEISIITRAATLQGFEDVINAPAKTSLVAEYEVTGSAATTITITDLDLNADIGWTIVAEWISANTSNSALACYVNGDTVGTYLRRYILAYSSTLVTNNDGTTSQVTTLGAAVGAVTLATTDMTQVGGNIVYNTNSQIAATINAFITYHKYTASNVTSLAFTSLTASSIGIGSKIKIYRWLV